MVSKFGATTLGLILMASFEVMTASAGMKDIPHPFLLWTKEEAADLRKKMDTDPLVKQQYENMAKKSAGGRAATLRSSIYSTTWSWTTRLPARPRKMPYYPS